ncbi:hypothetical protein [Microbulbifer sp. SSSA005]|uniref:hypothetical protein n=1 Tax=Microbulbifer sp. SSSA005 TaxID=3243378 RepID=UPI004039F992
MLGQPVGLDCHCYAAPAHSLGVKHTVEVIKNMIASISNEIKRAPVATISSAAGVIFAGITLFLAILQFKSGISIQSGDISTSSGDKDSVNVGNLFLAVSFFASSSFTVAVIVRLIARRHDLAALFLSVPMAALVNFVTVVMLYLAPPKELTKDLFTSAHDLVLYSSVFVFLIVCGRAVLVDLARSVTENEKSDTTKDKASDFNVLSILFLCALMVGIWSTLVFKGQLLLSKTFLPEITTPHLPNKEAKNA